MRQWFISGTKLAFLSEISEKGVVCLSLRVRGAPEMSVETLFVEIVNQCPHGSDLTSTGQGDHPLALRFLCPLILRFISFPNNNSVHNSACYQYNANSNQNDIKPYLPIVTRLR